MSVRVLVVDDQAMVRAGFAALLDAQRDIQVVGQASDGEEGVRLALETRPDVVLMDVRMPVLDGIEATRAILAPDRPRPLPKVVVLTTFDVDDYVLDALRAGASGFLLKDALPAELVEAVRVVARGDALLAPSVTRRLIERIAGRPTGTTATGADLDVLTGREREVLREVAQGRSNSEIAGVLFIAEQTVKSHVSRVLTKLGLRDRAQAVVVAYESGLVVPGD
ncbi:response regulator [uncultured Amnibacterium sp.]|uniref:response regulator n=1 Tax=uncultured Amnibacterium sp. TaxID=1631851 RepID=UPI0035CB0E25